MSDKQYDVLTFGRSSIDLYSQNIGADFIDIKGFDAFVGGSPLNIAVACSRLGLTAALLSGVGDDKVGDFIINFLKNEKVITSSVRQIKGKRSSAVILGTEPPDKFPLVYYRENAADSHVNIDDVIQAKIPEFRLLEISGTALNVEPGRSAAFFAAETAVDSDIPVVFDLDFRADQWHDPRAFGIMVRAILPKVEIAIGTEEEVLAATLTDISRITITDQQISGPEIQGNLENAINKILKTGIKALIVKKGSKGARIYMQHEYINDVPGFPVDVVNVLGAGDAFAGGFIYGYLKGWDLYKSCRMGNACGALVVQQSGCANFMPVLDVTLAFIEERGGF